MKYIIRLLQLIYLVISMVIMVTLIVPFVYYIITGKDPLDKWVDLTDKVLNK